jgi:hypothetical protein
MTFSYTRRKVFISYHHADQYWKNSFVQDFCDRQGIFYDGSLDDRVASTQPEYVHRQIREEYVTGTSVTIVLCGAETWKRRYIDWEIHSTLLKTHGLFGIIIPDTPQSGINNYLVPDRLSDNLGAYAALYHWPVSGDQLRAWIEESIARAQRTTANNSRIQMTNNRP